MMINDKNLNRTENNRSTANYNDHWEVLMWFDSEAAARVSGAAETVDYFG